jgi:ABC-type ATPase with predicted acetyltransferase domain
LDGDNLFLLEDFTVTHNSGKSTLLKNFGIEEEPQWNPNKSIVSHFNDPDDAINKLGSVGLNSVPSWYKPYQVLSNGEKFRADLARKVKDGAVIDEFTSVVDRVVAKAASVSLSRYVKNNEIENVVISTCHHDILDWLEPDWVIDTDTGEFTDGFFLSDRQSNLTYIAQTMIVGECLKTTII